MRLHRFYIQNKIEEKAEAEITVREERLFNQWKNVLRYKTGDKVILFNGDGKEWLGEFKDLERKEGKIKILEEKTGVIPKRKITLYQSIIKKDKMEWIVEKATELGVSKIVPIISERSEKKGFNLERANKIAIEASEQCGRGDVPVISEITTLSEALENSGNTIIFDSSGKSLELGAESLEKTPSFKLKALSLFIGPEGGWSPEEIKRFKARLNDKVGQEAKMEILNLGDLTLRAETAAIAALSRLGGF